MTDVELDTVLAEKLAELDEQLAALTAPAEETGDISFGKRVGDGTSIAVERLAQVAAHDRLQRLRADVQRSQAKRAEGSYGICDRCGEPIPEERLEALPWATTHVECRP